MYTIIPLVLMLSLFFYLSSPSERRLRRRISRLPPVYWTFRQQNLYRRLSKRRSDELWKKTWKQINKELFT